MKTYLALGDSYTIGEKIGIATNFPFQLVKKMNSFNEASFALPKIIATTGWTTTDLIENINQSNIKEQFDLVTLLIGVNNQYRNWDISIFKKEFKELLHTAISLANNKNEQVFVLSIPDWGYTPFAADKNTSLISNEIDNYNFIKQQITEDAKCSFINITEDSRRHGKEKTYLAEDGLHYSAKAFDDWTQKLLPYLQAIY